MYRILSLNGGGIRGYITALVLAHIEKTSGKRIHEMFDLIVGTSVGSITGCLLDNLPAKHIASLYTGDIGKRLFAPNLFSIGGLLGAKYSTEEKERVFKEILGTKSKTTNFDFAAVSYDLISSRPIIFNTLEDDNDARYLMTSKYNLYDSCLASSAAPVFWNPHSLEHMILVDGALVCNDPTNIGIKLALDQGRSLRDMYIVNITTGYNTRPYPFETSGLALRWLAPMFRILLSGQPNATSMLYRNEDLNYINLDVELINGSDNIDDVSHTNLDCLYKDSQILIKNNKPSIDKIIKDLC